MQEIFNAGWPTEGSVERQECQLLTGKSAQQQVYPVLIYMQQLAYVLEPGHAGGLLLAAHQSRH